MPTNVTAQTAYGPMVLAAVEHNQPPARRLVDDDLAAAFLPARLRMAVAATRVGWVREAAVAAVERSGPGLWASIACRKRLIDDRVSDPFNSFDAVVVLGAGFDTRAYRIARHSDLPVFEVDQQVNVERKAEVVRRVLQLVDRNEYKRYQSAPGPRVSNRAFGRERRYPLVNAWTIES